MRRVLIVGNSGGGKSTLARALGARLGLPVIHLDILFWKPGWVESEEAEFRLRVAEALSGPDWVCDGNFGTSFEVSMPRADTIVWIDQPRLVCVARAFWRAVSYRRGGRPDMAEGCGETIDFQFYGYIWNFNRKSRPRLEASLARLGRHARLVRLRSDREIAGFIAKSAAG